MLALAVVGWAGPRRNDGGGSTRCGSEPGSRPCVRVLRRAVGGGGALALLWHVAMWGGRVRSARALGLGAVLLGGAGAVLAQDALGLGL